MLPQARAAAPGARGEHPPSARQHTWARTPAAALTGQIPGWSTEDQLSRAGAKLQEGVNIPEQLVQLSGHWEAAWSIPLPGIPSATNPKHIISRWECLWNTFSVLQDPALEQTVASLPWESITTTRARGRAKGHRTRAVKTQTDTSVFIIFHLLCTIEI